MRTGRTSVAAVAATALVVSLLAGTPAAADQVSAVTTQVFRSIGERIAFNGALYFVADDGTRGTELWRTDGSADGATLVKDFAVGGAASGSTPRFLTVAGNRLYFSTNDGVDAEGVAAGLWYIEGAGAPVPLRDGDGRRARVHGLTAVGNRLFATWSSAVRTVDPGTAVLRELPDDVRGNVETGIAFGGHLYLNLSIVGGATPNELWRTDGTRTQLVKNIAPDVGRENRSNPEFLATTDRGIFFLADDSVTGKELWYSDGTTDGTRFVFDHQPARGTYVPPGGAVTVGRTLFYTPDDAVTGVELWRSDGTPAGTRVVKDIVPGVTHGVQSNRVHLTALGSRVAMFSGAELWISDGTAGGTRLVTRLPGVLDSVPVVVGSKIYFTAWSSRGYVLWRSDGTAGGTFALSSGGFDSVTSGQSSARGATVLGSRVVFPATFYQAPGTRFAPYDVRLYTVDTTRPDVVRRATTRPTVSGKLARYGTLAVSSGNWAPAAPEITYQWYVSGKPVAGATRPSFYLLPKYEGKTIHAVVTAAGPGARPASVKTAPKVLKGKLTVTRKPAIKGKARVGRTLKIVKPKVDAKGTKQTYQWYAGSKKIPKATKAKYKVAAKYRGKKISVRVKVTKKNYRTVILRSPATVKVARR
ncbi:ELWxxDGT repeat protein [Flavimobilis soli]|uniref:ELWxxDGT repeat protein n=1 Tax=Flavimobilis soli TaxID=442709 RepID=A0A2A9EFY0_9MICO|nr:ELWxxDGT repeat protein [Flavimobilis soli]